jgi:hypothetical protein
MNIEARLALQELRQPGWWDACVERATGLPAAMAALARPVLDGHDPAGWDQAVRNLRDGAERFDQAAPADRVRFFAAFFPRLGETLEATWQAGRTRPYHGAFRAPRLPSASARERMDAFALLLSRMAGLDPDPPFVARWAAHLDADWAWAAPFGDLLATALDAGGPDGDGVFAMIRAAAAGTDEFAEWAACAPRALLTSGREDCWDFAERLLLDTERDGDLRRAILGSSPSGHPRAFRRLLKLVIDHGLSESESAAEAVTGWLALGCRAEDVAEPGRLIERIRSFLDDPAARGTAIGRGTGEEAYVALWCLACADAEAAIEAAQPLLASRQPERRYAAAHLLGQVKLPAAAAGLRRALADDDLRVAERAVAGLDGQAEPADDETFGALEQLLNRLGRHPRQLPPILWRRDPGTLEPAAVAAALAASAAEGRHARLLPYLPLMDPYTRAGLARQLGQTPLAGDRRQAILRLAGDSAAAVRREALAVAAGMRVTAGEAAQCERLLQRKAADLRHGIVAVLLDQPDDAVLASARRLLGGAAAQRLAGLELLRRLTEASRSADAARDLALRYAAGCRPSPEEQQQIAAIGGGPGGEITGLDATLGLVDRARRTPPAQPADRGVTLMTKAAGAALVSLDALVHEHRDDPVDLSRYDDEASTTTTLQMVGHRFPAAMNAITGWRGTADRLPLREVWLEWNRGRPPDTRDEDGFELVRAAGLLAHGGERTWTEAGLPAARHGIIVMRVLAWLLLLDCPPGAAGFALDAAETLLASVPPDLLREAPGSPHPRWRDPVSHWCDYLEVARVLSVVPGHFGDESWRRLWALERWVQDPLPDDPRPHSLDRPRLEYLLRAHAAGAASDDDLIDHLLGSGRQGTGHWITHRDLHELSGSRDEGLHWMPPDPAARAVVDRIRQRVAEVELHRGEGPTPASGAALSLRFTGGLDVLAGALGKLGRAPLRRGWSYDTLDEHNVLSHLIRCSQPGRGDTAQRFAEAIGPLRAGERRLAELAAFAPQWAGHIEALLGWPGLASGAWWMHAHTKDVNWKVDGELRQAWEEQIAERTPLTAADLLDGSVDIWWFADAYAQLGPDRWAVLDAAAKYCSTGAGHKRAQLFADAIRGRAGEAGLRGDITGRRHQDSVRALGLLPLPAAARRHELIQERYELIQEFRRTSRQFGPRRRESEHRAADIALANLARIAGYRDPLRLSWAMEARGVADLAAQPQAVEVDGVRVSLSLDETGAPELAVSRNGAPLAAVPAKSSRSPEVKALRARAAELRRQAARARDSLEAAMILGDVFTGRELRELAAHPLLAPALAALAVAGDRSAGYPAGDFSVLLGPDGTRHAVAEEEELRIAHPVDLRQRAGPAAWQKWQRDCEARHVVQPFKQIFRETYRPADGEWDAAASRRYAGRELEPRRALALLGSRGWVSRPDREARKIFHAAQIIVRLSFVSEFVSLAATDRLVLDEVSFSHRETWEPVPAGDVPGRLFSEVMRDIDLAVSVSGEERS